MLIPDLKVLWAFQSWPDHAYLNRLDQFFAYWSLSTCKKSNSNHNLFSIGLIIPIWKDWINLLPADLYSICKKKKKKKKKSISHHNLFSRQESGESWNLIGENYFLVCPGTYSHICLKKFNQYITLKDAYVEATNQLHSSIDLEILRLLKISKNAAIWLPKSTLSDKSQTRHFPEMQYSHNHKEDYGSSR